MTVSLDFLPQTAFAFLLIFARIGAMTMALPGIGERMVPARIRLVFALALSMILYPLVNTVFPALPGSLYGMVVAIAREVVIGVAIGISVKLIVSAIQFVGTIISFQTGLAFAQNVDPANGAQSTLFGTFLSVLSVALIFAADLHHLLLSAMYDSYQLFKPGGFLPAGDFAQSAVDTLSRGFRIAIQLTGPFLAFGLIFYLGIGVLSRLIPQVHVFFLALPLNIMLGMFLFMLLLGTFMLWYLDYFGEAIRPYLS
ncbi:MAG: flagellar type III secretion system protein FliR [Hyphomicrobiaceae bacterium]|nr:flagellar type III secretion system protein FliR [Hyphomicrobiaceae bacterium]